jgi:predicted dehydrogenase
LKKKILLVGCGNIGSRHLQALVKLPNEIEIEIIEPNIDAQNLAKKRLEEITFDKSQFNFLWNASFENSKNHDLVIIATLSNNRLELIKTLIKLGNRRFLIEKMVCQSEQEYESILSLITKTNSKGWVNASRRYFNSYQKIRDQLEENFVINLSIFGGNMGLGSNAIHFVDLFSWFTKNDQFVLNGDFLDNEIQENKRGVDYKEFSGTIMGKSQNNSNISIIFSQENDSPLYVIFHGNKTTLIIDETNETFLELRNGIKKEFKMEFQSTLTTKIVKDIFEGDNCLLPTLDESKIAHFELFKIFNEHIKKITNCEVEKCPIT